MGTSKRTALVQPFNGLELFTKREDPLWEPGPARGASFERAIRAERPSGSFHFVALNRSSFRCLIRFAWLFLVLAIATEVVGLTVMKAASTSDAYIGHAVMYASIALSYVFLARAVKASPVRSGKARASR
ncbi:hypothetical protein USDA257_c37170 [Sinorhizobium fredii USDA 257]|uniref:Uncharacterized protein n=1 Tax=Sinorhizobium fredii (strain USDA 257) TaxID=1185652 RepID=I3X8R0_SINF2|nr:hypothetical protein USDA257_c37170 [Sinorhizobium fredii USDA 257]